MANQIKIASVCLPAMQAMGICGRDSSDTPYFRTFKIQLFNPILDGVLDTPIMDGGQKPPKFNSAICLLITMKLSQNRL